MFASIRSRLILIAALVVASVYFLFPRNVTIRERAPNGVMRDTVVTRVPLKRGLDLQGGMHLALELDQSKQVSAKPIGRSAWRFEDVEPHWDELILRSFIAEDGKKVPYQEGLLGKIRRPRDLIAGWNDGDKRLPAGVAMFCGTLPAIGGIRPSSRFDMEIEDPVLGRRLSHSYIVQALPVIS